MTSKIPETIKIPSIPIYPDKKPPISEPNMLPRESVLLLKPKALLSIPSGV
ncbi:hypothetical protein D3C73_1568870 [compost metagenome]